MQDLRGQKQPEHWALVPVKSLENSKQRLESCLGEFRGAFSLAMLRDVLDALSRSQTIDAVAVVTEDPDVRQLTESRNLLAIGKGSSAGLNADVTHAVETLQGMGAKRITVIHADLPLVTSREIDRVCGAYKNPSVADTSQAGVISPSADHQGTNILSFDADHPIPFRYGPNSFNLHFETVREKQTRLVTVESETLSIDIDEPSDLEQLFVYCRRHPEYQSSASWMFLERAGMTSIDQQHAPIGPHSREEIIDIAAQSNLESLCETAAQLRDTGHGDLCTYSPKVFLPITRLCRDFCHYCTFATMPKHLDRAYMTVDEVLELAHKGAAMGCKEALFTLGERPELRHPTARQALDEMGFETTLEYVAHVAKCVLDETGLLPHINAGCMTVEEIRMLRKVSASMGMMLESSAARLCEKGQVHYGSPDKDPVVRLKTLEDAGREGVPFTTGILIGIGETREERLDSLLAIRHLHLRYGHIQEIIIQNFVPKADTKMANVSPPDHDELRWTVAMARIIFGPEMSIQAPPNLNPGHLESLIRAGVNDWGGVSPLTPDHVNPESPWPELDALEQHTARAGKTLQQRLTIYPRYVTSMTHWLDKVLEAPVLKLADSAGLAREDDWLTGKSEEIPAKYRLSRGIPKFFFRNAQPSRDICSILAKTECDEATLSVDEISTLFNARGEDFAAVCQTADERRRQNCGDTVSYVANRNINYTNICSYRCHFCAFAKGRKNTELSDAPYLKSPEEVGQLALEAWNRGATEVCLQGGIHPSFTGQTYLDICSAVREAVPGIHIHAFSPLEVTHGAETLGLSLGEFLAELKRTGLGTLPGTAAEILCDDVRAVICPDKINTRQWLDVLETAHSLDLPTTSTIMFGHIDRYYHWAKHLLELLHLQHRSGGITEFVPLPFVAAEAPIYRRGQSRRGPTFREAVLMHAVSRLVLSPAIANIQTSWVKMGLQGAKFCLQAGANDIGGTLMNESITRAAGAKHGQEMTPHTLEAAVTALRRTPLQRNTLYGETEKKAYVAV
jgi:FO synthase